MNRKSYHKSSILFTLLLIGFAGGVMMDAIENSMEFMTGIFSCLTLAGLFWGATFYQKDEEGKIDSFDVDALESSRTPASLKGLLNDVLALIPVELSGKEKDRIEAHFKQKFTQLTDEEVHQKLRETAGSLGHNAEELKKVVLNPKDSNHKAEAVFRSASPNMERGNLDSIHHRLSKQIDSQFSSMQSTWEELVASQNQDDLQRMEHGFHSNLDKMVNKLEDTNELIRELWEEIGTLKKDDKATKEIIRESERSLRDELAEVRQVAKQYLRMKDSIALTDEPEEILEILANEFPVLQEFLALEEEDEEELEEGEEIAPLPPVETAVPVTPAPPKATALPDDDEEEDGLDYIMRTMRDDDAAIEAILELMDERTGGTPFVDRWKELGQIELSHSRMAAQLRPDSREGFPYKFQEALDQLQHENFFEGIQKLLNLFEVNKAAQNLLTQLIANFEAVWKHQQGVRDAMRNYAAQQEVDSRRVHFFLAANRLIALTEELAIANDIPLIPDFRHHLMKTLVHNSVYRELAVGFAENDAHKLNGGLKELRDRLNLVSEIRPFNVTDEEFKARFSPILNVYSDIQTSHKFKDNLKEEFDSLHSEQRNLTLMNQDLKDAYERLERENGQLKQQELYLEALWRRYSKIGEILNTKPRNIIPADEKLFISEFISLALHTHDYLKANFGVPSPAGHERINIDMVLEGKNIDRVAGSKYKWLSALANLAPDKVKNLGTMLDKLGLDRLDGVLVDGIYLDPGAANSLTALPLIPIPDIISEEEE